MPGSIDETVLQLNGGLVMVLVSGILMTAFVIGNCLRTGRASWLPESLVVIGLGVLLGFTLPTAGSTFYHWGIPAVSVEEESIINELVLNLLLLPIIIFEAGWSLKPRDFVGQLPYVLIFAIGGTLISTLVVGSLLWATSWSHHVREVRTCFAYAALISAVDPVATLSTYNHLDVDPLLNTLVFGESVINDAVAIVLFKVLNSPSVQAFEQETTHEVVLEIAKGVFLLLFGSVGLGLALGCFYILILRFAGMRRSPALEILFVFLCSFFTYSFAESVCHMSGIITVLFCSMLMSAYATPHLTIEGNLLASFLLKQFASLADMIVFLFVGIASVYMQPIGVILSCWVMLFCMVGRAAAVFPLGGVCNCIKIFSGRHLQPEKRHVISGSQLLMMWHAGLRGGIALVLTLQLGPWVDDIDGPGTRLELYNSTLAVIIGYLLVFGGTTEAMLKLLGIPFGNQPPLYHHMGPAYKALKRFQSRVILPLLVGEAAASLDVQSGILSKVLESASRRSSWQGAVDADALVSIFGCTNPTRATEFYSRDFSAEMPVMTCSPSTSSSDIDE